MNYYNYYFKTNRDNIKNTWKDIKSILNITSIAAKRNKSKQI